jgi:hypothetical protein
MYRFLVGTDKGVLSGRKSIIGMVEACCLTDAILDAEARFALDCRDLEVLELGVSRRDANGRWVPTMEWPETCADPIQEGGVQP